jgi:hypothetical protein
MSRYRTIEIFGIPLQDTFSQSSHGCIICSSYDLKQVLLSNYCLPWKKIGLISPKTVADRGRRQNRSEYMGTRICRLRWTSSLIWHLWVAIITGPDLRAWFEGQVPNLRSEAQMHNAIPTFPKASSNRLEIAIVLLPSFNLSSPRYRRSNRCWYTPCASETLGYIYNE